MTEVQKQFVPCTMTDTEALFNPVKDSKYNGMSENWELGFAPLYQHFVDS